MSKILRRIKRHRRSSNRRPRRDARAATLAVASLAPDRACAARAAHVREVVAREHDDAVGPAPVHGEGVARARRPPAA